MDKSQQEVADKIEISRSVLSQYENGLVEPTENVIRKFALYFEVSADYLLGLEDDFGVRTATPTDEIYSFEERQLIRQYRSLPDKIKKTIRDQIEVYSEPSEILPKQDKKV